MLKSISLLMIVLLNTFTFSCAQKNDVEDIKSLVYSFALAGDKNDFKAMENQLDDNYRVIMNRLFGSETVSIMDRQTYISKIRSKEFGGDNRSITIKDVIVHENTASALVTFQGQKMTFVSTMLFVKDSSAQWKIISEMPNII